MKYNRSPKAEIIRSVQKDLIYTNELSADLSEILQFTQPRVWIRYNNLCKLFSEIVYHGFASIQNLQTLGEEYTGIFQIDNQNISIPSKLIRLISIIFEFGGEYLYVKLLNELEKNVVENRDILPEAKSKIKYATYIMINAIPYVKAIHKSYFYYSDSNSKYHISKRLTRINYIHVRNWLKQEHSMYGYKLLGILTFLQMTFAIALRIHNTFTKRETDSFTILENTSIFHQNLVTTKCTLCLEDRKNTSLTPCGHIFCWVCILNWLDEKDECPLCRDKINKSCIIPLQNYA